MAIPPMTWLNAAENCFITGSNSVKPLIIDKYSLMTGITTIETTPAHIILNLNQEELENQNNELINIDVRHFSLVNVSDKRAKRVLLPFSKRPS